MNNSNAFNDLEEIDEVEVAPFAGLDYVNDVGNDGIIVLSPIRSETRSRVIPIKMPNVLRDYLITHFSLSFRLGRIQWPKNMRQKQRHLYSRPTPITQPAAVMHALCIVRETLYVKTSVLLLVFNSNAMKDVLDDGLFLPV